MSFCVKHGTEAENKKETEDQRNSDVLKRHTLGTKWFRAPSPALDEKQESPESDRWLVEDPFWDLRRTNHLLLVDDADLHICCIIVNTPELQFDSRRQFQPRLQLLSVRENDFGLKKEDAGGDTVKLRGKSEIPNLKMNCSCSLAENLKNPTMVGLCFCPKEYVGPVAHEAHIR